MIIADANLISYLLIQGTHTEAAREAYVKDSAWVVPPLWRSEFLNVLATSVRAKVITERQAHIAWDIAVQLLTAAERQPDPMAALSISVINGISAYDAQYVALAQMLETRVVTSDRPLIRKCPKYVVSIRDFLG